MLPNKKDLRKVRPTLGSTIRSKATPTTKTTTKTKTRNAFELTKENVESAALEEADESERITLREYFRTTSKWNIAIDIISVLILIVELASTGVEKAGLLSCIPPPPIATTPSPSISFFIMCKY